MGAERRFSIMGICVDACTLAKDGGTLRAAARDHLRVPLSPTSRDLDCLRL